MTSEVQCQCNITHGLMKAKYMIKSCELNLVAIICIYYGQRQLLSHSSQPQCQEKYKCQSGPSIHIVQSLNLEPKFQIKEELKTNKRCRHYMLMKCCQN